VEKDEVLASSPSLKEAGVTTRVYGGAEEHYHEVDVFGREEDHQVCRL